jgi:hypothetical protein
MLELIKRSLEIGEDVLISGFGKFYVKKKGGAERPEPCDRRGHDDGAKESGHVPELQEAKGKIEGVRNWGHGRAILNQIYVPYHNLLKILDKARKL